MVHKEKYKVEYLLEKVSKAILWKSVSTADGLQDWFADQVSNIDDDFVFTWKGHSEHATRLSCRDGVSIRFHWLHEPADTFFEFKIQELELTGDVSLTITDFADKGDVEDAVLLWNTQIDELRRVTGM
ncbi:MAG TPA: START-like domain-containing protein [Paludibacteraceae bacterium]|jgi:hypothetical protein|nr:START-like domain-containing protein [Paludibacteraceae bacterium]HQB68934.1 START-like domain-containing protein [Paludibacteraceae bacterium]HRS67244.1 START-like domain-containing protein [Paludibacteraceae bacterium]